jgi:hypothetical protein
MRGRERWGLQMRGRERWGLIVDAVHASAVPLPNAGVSAPPTQQTGYAIGLFARTPGVA